MIIILGAQDYTWSGSGNCGDGLIDFSCKSLVDSISGCGSLLIPYNKISRRSVGLLNSASAVIIPAFTFWNGLKKENPIFSILPQLKVSISPLAINTIYRPRSQSLDEIFDFKIDSKSLKCIRDIHSSMDMYYCRESGVAKVLGYNGISNASVIGDFGFYDKSYSGKGMHNPRHIKKIVFTAGHYLQENLSQALSVMNFLRNKFPDANIVYSLHSKHTESNALLVQAAKELSFDIHVTSYDCRSIDFYDKFDLHVGYRVHGFLAFLRKRRPAILIAEDNRGIGFGLTLNCKGVFPAFSCSRDSGSIKLNPDLIGQIDAFIDSELSSCFSGYNHIPSLIDEMLEEKVIPLLEKRIEIARSDFADRIKKRIFFDGVVSSIRSVVRNHASLYPNS